MPGKTRMTLWYVVLALAVFASAGFMGIQIRERIRPDHSEDDSLQVLQGNRSGTEKTATAKETNETAEHQRIALLFRQKQVFQPVVTPKPTNTPVPLPPPSPTARPLAQNYKIRSIMGNSAILIDYRLIPIAVRKDRVVKDPLGDFQVMEVDANGQRVLVRLLLDGSERWITEKEGPQGAPRNPRQNR